MGRGGAKPMSLFLVSQEARKCLPCNFKRGGGLTATGLLVLLLALIAGAVGLYYAWICLQARPLRPKKHRDAEHGPLIPPDPDVNGNHEDVPLDPSAPVQEDDSSDNKPHSDIPNQADTSPASHSAESPEPPKDKEDVLISVEDDVPPAKVIHEKETAPPVNCVAPIGFVTPAPTASPQETPMDHHPVPRNLQPQPEKLESPPSSSSAPVPVYIPSPPQKKPIAISDEEDGLLLHEPAPQDDSLSPDLCATLPASHSRKPCLREEPEIMSQQPPPPPPATAPKSEGVPPAIPPRQQTAVPKVDIVPEPDVQPVVVVVPQAAPSGPEKEEMKPVGKAADTLPPEVCDQPAPVPMKDDEGLPSAAPTKEEVPMPAPNETPAAEAVPSDSLKEEAAIPATNEPPIPPPKEAPVAETMPSELAKEEAPIPPPSETSAGKAVPPEPAKEEAPIPPPKEAPVAQAVPPEPVKEEAPIPPPKEAPVAQAVPPEPAKEEAPIPPPSEASAGKAVPPEPAKEEAPTPAPNEAPVFGAAPPGSVIAKPEDPVNKEGSVESDDSLSKDDPSENIEDREAPKPTPENDSVPEKTNICEETRSVSSCSVSSEEPELPPSAPVSVESPASLQLSPPHPEDIPSTDTTLKPSNMPEKELTPSMPVHSPDEAKDVSDVSSDASDTNSEDEDIPTEMPVTPSKTRADPCTETTAVPSQPAANISMDTSIPMEACNVIPDDTSEEDDGLLPVIKEEGSGEINSEGSTDTESSEPEVTEYSFSSGPTAPSTTSILANEVSCTMEPKVTKINLITDLDDSDSECSEISDEDLEEDDLVSPAEGSDEELHDKAENVTSEEKPAITFEGSNAVSDHKDTLEKDLVPEMKPITVTNGPVASDMPDPASKLPEDEMSVSGDSDTESEGAEAEVELKEEIVTVPAVVQENTNNHSAVPTKSPKSPLANHTDKPAETCPPKPQPLKVLQDNGNSLENIPTTTDEDDDGLSLSPSESCDLSDGEVMASTPKKSMIPRLVKQNEA
ncbi:cell surface glycoprotein 1-like isoform X2 [Portunus trituberculatus]|uniref:cell surface glycoprotein 1-like isoform X2 n=1 Tax=Portunus trituberculatus TaxID=210409 RepID=UPI001E1CC0D8|nr:cell surface glycoprotein 1-like isoform X2 [Portunus trituberculatus]